MRPRRGAEGSQRRYQALVDMTRWTTAWNWSEHALSVGAPAPPPVRAVIIDPHLVSAFPPWSVPLRVFQTEGGGGEQPDLAW